MSQPKVFEFAKEIGMSPLALMDKIRSWKLPVRSHMAELEPEMLEQIKTKLKGGDAGEAAPVVKKKKVAAKNSKENLPHCRVVTDLLDPKGTDGDAIQSWRVFRIMSEFVSGFSRLRIKG